jgi:hypothetical protein
MTLTLGMVRFSITASSAFAGWAGFIIAIRRRCRTALGAPTHLLE